MATRRTTFLLMAALLAVGCTADQRSWIHENVPVIGLLFKAAVPAAAPLIDLATQLILGGATLAGLAAAKYKHSGLPGINTEWTKINRKHRDAPRRERLLLLDQRRRDLKKQDRRDDGQDARIDALQAKDNPHGV